MNDRRVQRKKGKRKEKQRLARHKEPARPEDESIPVTLEFPLFSNDKVSSFSHQVSFNRVKLAIENNTPFCLSIKHRLPYEEKREKSVIRGNVKKTITLYKNAIGYLLIPPVLLSEKLARAQFELSEKHTIIPGSLYLDFKYELPIYSYETNINPENIEIELVKRYSQDCTRWLFYEELKESYGKVTTKNFTNIPHHGYKQRALPVRLSGSTKAVTECKQHLRQLGIRTYDFPADPQAFYLNLVDTYEAMIRKQQKLAYVVRETTHCQQESSTSSTTKNEEKQVVANSTTMINHYQPRLFKNNPLPEFGISFCNEQRFYKLNQ